MPGSTTHRGESKETPPQYPEAIFVCEGMELRELSALKCALDNGLGVNSLLSEAQLMPPQPKGGCVVHEEAFDEHTWPHFNTPFQRAVTFRDFESAEYLLQQGADIDLYNSIGQTALHEAVQNRRTEAVKFLLERGANIDKPTIEAHARFEDRNRDLYGRDGDLALWMVLRASDTVGLRLLIEGGVDLHPPAQGPWTALDLAVLAGDVNSVKVLLPQDHNLSDVLHSTGSINEDDHKNAARQLLLITKTGTLVPPHDLYDAYCKARSHMEHVGDKRGLEPLEIKASINTFLDALHEIAGELREPKFNQCAACRQFLLGLSDTYTTYEKLRLQIHTDRQALEDCVREGCRLCSLVADALDFGKPDMFWNKSEICETYPDVPSGIFLTALPLMHLRRPDHFSIHVQCEDTFKSFNLVNSYAKIYPRLDAPTEEDLHTGSATAIRVAQNWIRRCEGEHSHSACQKVYRNRQVGQDMPLRLIYIPPEIGNQPRLIEASMVCDPYCVLSYCWGKEPFFMTKKNNIVQNMHTIPYKLLPIMFRDAIEVTRALGYSYLWIDALCIIQDDTADWAREAMRMHIIYSNAALTISTLIAENCHTSLFRPRILRVNHAVPLDIWLPKDKIIGGHLKVAIPDWSSSNATLRGPVHFRAWTLQEQLLSPRILYFGDGMLHWECLSSYSFESDPEEWSDSHQNRGVLRSIRNVKRSLHIASIGEIDGSVHEEPVHFEIWKEQLKAFTLRDITKNSDRLPAFFSISERLAKIADNTPVCGIWNGSRLLESLCWSVINPKAYPEIMPVIPTWSWAHVESAISFSLFRGSHGAIRPLCTVLSLDIQAHEMMSETTGSITVKGTLRRMARSESATIESARVTQGTLPQKADHDGWDEFLANEAIFLQYDNYRNGATFIFDHSPEPAESYLAFDLLMFPQGPKPTGYGYPAFPNGIPSSKAVLLLLPVNDDLKTFRRIGIANMPALELKQFSEAMLDQVITIV